MFWVLLVLAVAVSCAAIVAAVGWRSYLKGRSLVRELHAMGLDAQTMMVRHDSDPRY